MNGPFRGIDAASVIREFCRKNMFSAQTPSGANIAAIINIGTTKLAVGSGGAIWRARGRPVVWSAATSPTANDLNGIAIGIRSGYLPTAVVVGNAGDAAFSTITMKDWSAITSTRSLDLTTIAGDGVTTWLTGGVAEAGAQVWKIVDTGSSFTMSALSTPAGMDGTPVNSIAHVSGQIFLAATEANGLWLTTDAGTNWTNVWAPSSSEKLFSITVGYNCIIVGGSDSAESSPIWIKSTDSGATWNVVTPTGADTLNKIWYYDGATNGRTWLVPTGADHAIYSSDDGAVFEEFGYTGYFGIGNAPIVNYVCAALIPVEKSTEPKDLIHVLGSDSGIISYSLTPYILQS